MCQAHSIRVDEAEEFSEKILNALNGGALAVMLSLGHRSGLLEALASVRDTSSEELAQRSRLNERYVREWLGAMACAGVVTLDASGQRYCLPEAGRPLLTRAGGVDNMAGLTQFISMFGQVEEGILACFKNGGGLGYDSYERFHDIMAEDSGQSTLSSLFDAILPLVPQLDQRLREGIDVLDLGCGQGHALLAMAERYPNSRFTGYDLCEAPLVKARAVAQEHKLTNTVFETLDAATLNSREAFDFIVTFDAIHDQARPDIVLQNIHAGLRPGGSYLMQDIDASSQVADNIEHPLGTFLYTISTTHCMSVSLARGGLGLGTMWGREKAREMLRAAGFGEVTEHSLSHDPQNRYYVTGKSSA